MKIQHLIQIESDDDDDSLIEFTKNGELPALPPVGTLMVFDHYPYREEESSCVYKVETIYYDEGEAYYTLFYNRKISLPHHIEMFLERFIIDHGFEVDLNHIHAKHHETVNRVLHQLSEYKKKDSH